MDAAALSDLGDYRLAIPATGSRFPTDHRGPLGIHLWIPDTHAGTASRTLYSKLHFCMDWRWHSFCYGTDEVVS